MLCFQRNLGAKIKILKHTNIGDQAVRGNTTKTQSQIKAMPDLLENLLGVVGCGRRKCWRVQQLRRQRNGRDLGKTAFRNHTHLRCI